MTKWALSHGCKGSPIITKQLIWCTILTNRKIKTIYLKRCREILWQNSTPISENKNKQTKNTSPEGRHRRNLPQHNKSHIWQNHRKHYPQWQNIESISSKVRNKTRVPNLSTTLLQLWKSFPKKSEKKNKRDLDWKRSKTLTVCRWHDLLHRKP